MKCNLRSIRKCIFALAGGTRAGLLVGAFASAAAAWALFVVFNATFAAAAFSHLEHWPPMTYGEHRSAIAHGSGVAGGHRDRAQVDDLPVFATEGSFRDSPVAFSDVRSARRLLSLASNPFPEEVGSVFRFEPSDPNGPLVAHAMLLLIQVWAEPHDGQLVGLGRLALEIDQTLTSTTPKSWGCSNDAVTKALNALKALPGGIIGQETNEAIVLNTDVVRQVFDQAGSQAETRYRQLLANTRIGLCTPPANIFSLVLYDEESSAMVLEVSRDPTGSVTARTYLWLLDARDAAQQGGRCFVTGDSKVAVLRHRGSLLTGLQPIAVHVTEAALIDKLFRDETTLRLSIGRQPVAREDSREALMRGYFREILANRLSSSAASSERQALEAAVVWPRRLNGGNWWGLIQAATVWLGTWACLQAVCLILLSWQSMRGSRQQKETSIYEPSEYAADVYWASSLPGGIELARGAVDDASATLAFLNVAIPSVGFLGTVIGISEAMVGMGGAVTASSFERQGIVQNISVALGIAFDTTFVALAMGLLVMALNTCASKCLESLFWRANATRLQPSQRK